MSHKLKPILYSDSFLTQKLQPRISKEYFPDCNVPSASQDCLLKYFPKHYQRLKISFKSLHWSVLKKMKQIKTLHHLEIEEYDINKAKKSAQLIRKVLQNKRKHLKSIPSLSPLLSLQLGTFLPRIQILNLVPKWRYGWWNLGKNLRRSERKTWPFYKRFWVAFRNLKHVKMYEYDHDLQIMINEFNRNSQRLFALKTFALNFETSDDNLNWDYTNEAFEERLGSPSFLNHVTHLSFREDIFTSFKPLSRSFLQSCSKISHLSVQILNEKQDNGYASILRDIKTLENLKSLKLKIWDPRLFINQMEFPKSLQKLSLTIHYGEKKSSLWFLFTEGFVELVYGKKNSTALKPSYSKASLKFLDRWNKLTELKTLKLNLDSYSTDTSQMGPFNENFLPLLLKGARNLETLVLKFTFNYSINTYSQLSPILDALSDLKSLKHLTILDESKTIHRKLVLNIKSDLEKILLLSHLTSFNIDCVIQEPSSFRNFMKKFISDSQQPKNISFSEIKLTSNESLIELFQTLNSCHGSAQHNLSFKAHLCLNRFRDLLQSFRAPLILGEKIHLEIAIDFRVECSIFCPEYEEALSLLQKTFPQFKVAPSVEEDQFLLKNFFL